MKKISLSLITLSLSLSPAIFMFSCSSTINIEDLKISITNKKVVQADIDKAIIDFKNTNEVSTKIEILNGLFTNVTVQNFDNFDVTFDTTTTNFILTAKPGFAFGTQTTIKSRIVSLDLLIKAIPVTNDIALSSVVTYNSASTDIDKQNALKLVFSGITTVNFINFDVVASGDSITLNANEGYIFNSSQELKSVIKPS